MTIRTAMYNTNHVNSGRLFEVKFRYPNEDEKTSEPRGVKALKELIETVTTYNGTITSITSYDGEHEGKDVTSRYVK